MPVARYLACLLPMALLLGSNGLAAPHLDGSTAMLTASASGEGVALPVSGPGTDPSFGGRGGKGRQAGHGAACLACPRYAQAGTREASLPVDPGPVPRRTILRIVCVFPDAPGEDRDHPSGEYVVIENTTGNRIIDLDGWRLRDEAGHEAELQWHLQPGSEAEIDSSAFGQAVWDNAGDTVYLITPAGVRLDALSYDPRSGKGICP